MKNNSIDSVFTAPYCNRLSTCTAIHYTITPKLKERFMLCINQTDCFHIRSFLTVSLDVQGVLKTSIDFYRYR